MLLCAGRCIDCDGPSMAAAEAHDAGVPASALPRHHHPVFVAAGHKRAIDGSGMTRFIGAVQPEEEPQVAVTPLGKAPRTREELHSEMQEAAIALANSGHAPLVVLGARCGFPGETHLKGMNGRMRVLCHPDKNQNSEQSTAAFRALSTAWDTMKTTTAAALEKFAGEPHRFREEQALARAIAARYDMPPPFDYPEPPRAGAQASPPASPGPCAFLGYEIRRDYFSKASVLDFMQHTAARRVWTAERHCGSLLNAVSLLLSRGVQEGGDLHYVNVVSYRQKKHGKLQRMQSGLKFFRTENAAKFDALPLDVQQALRHEKAANVPPAAMGKSIFHMYGRLLRLICRRGLEKSGMKAVDIDIVRCYPSLRYHHATAGRQARCPVMETMVSDPEGFTSALAVVSGLAGGVVKQHITAACNCSSLGHIPLGELRDTLESLKRENVGIMTDEADGHPEIFAHYKDLPNGLAKFMSLIDADREAQALAHFDDPTCASNQYDGVEFFWDIETDVEEKLQEINAKIAPLRAVRKPHEQPLCAAQRKYPEMDWAHINDMRFGAFLEALRQCWAAFGPCKARFVDSVFGDVVRGRQQWAVAMKPDGTYDIWDDETHMWVTDANTDDLAERMRRELRECFGHPVVDVEGIARWALPPPPCEQDSFCAKIAACLARYSTKSSPVPLDDLANTTDRLLFADGRIVDFAAGTTRLAKPDDRLARHCRIPLPQWVVEQAVLDKMQLLGQKLCDFYIAGGKALEHHPPPEDVLAALTNQDSPEVQALRAEICGIYDELLLDDRCRLFRGVHNAFEDRDDAVFVFRVYSRVLSGHSGFAEAYALTGPPSGSKSWLTLPLLRLLGQGPQFLAQPLPTGYFTNAPRSDSDSSRPVTAQLGGCKLCIPKEVPVEPIVADALKSILDPRDVDVSARGNHSKKKESTSFPVTWTIVLPSQGAIVQRDDDHDCGVMDKIVELRPPFEFASPEDYDEQNSRHRRADHELADATDAGLLSGELLHIARCFHASITRAVCKGRKLQPHPPSAIAVREEKGERRERNRVREWMEASLEYCAEQDASPVPSVTTALQGSVGKVDASSRTAAGLGPRRWQCRRGGKNFYFYKVSLAPGDVARPVRLLGGDGGQR